MISGFKLRGGEHDLYQGILDYFLSLCAIFEDSRGMGDELTTVLCVESTKFSNSPDFQTCRRRFLS
jgi:hypothetical protein